MGKVKVGIIGMGFIALSHMDAVRRIGIADLVAATDVNYELAKKRAEEFGIPKCYRTVDELLEDDEVNVIHNCTPNNLHFEINEKIIKAGKHVFSEKPLCMTSAESEKMLEMLNNNKDIVHGVNFNYRMNPLVQDMKNKVREGHIGVPKLVHGSFMQDWLLFDTDYNWRLEPEIGGPSRCIADIGSHWIDSVQTVMGAKMTEVCADLLTVVPVRKKPRTQVETFSISNDEVYELKEIETEDYGAVLFKMDNGVHGVFHASQVSAGRKVYLNFEINGTKSSLYWNQESADRMWEGFRDKHSNQVIRNPHFMSEAAKEYTELAAGHPEGWNDALKNNIYSFYKFITNGKKIDKDSSDFASFLEGHYVMKVVEAIMKSSKTKQWINVE